MAKRTKLCKCGREKLLTGEYQRTLRATMEPDVQAAMQARPTGGTGR